MGNSVAGCMQQVLTEANLQHRRRLQGQPWDRRILPALAQLVHCSRRFLDTAKICPKPVTKC